ncbi:MAG: CCA tRNA nucleotidyltransferase [Prochlorococcaceae cyanobacterium]
MHTPGLPGHGPILGAAGKTPIAPCQAAALLRQALAPRRWPLPAHAFPAGTALVGGAVRDGLLGRLGERPDLDLVVPGDAIELCRRLSQRYGGSCVVLDQERSMARLVLQGWSLDLARCVGGDPIIDLGRRDYTINAMALPLQDGAALLDPHGGLADLAAGRLAAISEANLLDDPLRLLRGLRLAAELRFTIEPRSWQWIRQHHQTLGQVAPERVLAEVEKLAAAADGARGLALALESGLLTPWSRAPIGALEQLGASAGAHCGLNAAELEWALPLARLAALFGAADLARLRSSKRLQQRCQSLRRWRQQLAGADPERLPELEQLRLHRELEADLPALVLLLPLPAEQACRWLSRWRTGNDLLFHPRPPLDGRALQQQLGLAPSPQLGELIAHLTLEQAFGRLASETEALEAARHWLAEHRDDPP